MKQTLLLLAFILLSNWKSYGQVNDTGDEVGIGNSNPDMKLSVLTDKEYVSRFHSTSTQFMTGIRIGKTKASGGSSSEPDARLTVKGEIHAQEVRVDLTGAVAPDFVFQRNYDLKTLQEVEEFIIKNSHLPEIPSGTEMEEKGIELKQMNLKLLQKVEELTLYLIEQDKKINRLQDEVQELKSSK